MFSLRRAKIAISPILLPGRTCVSFQTTGRGETNESSPCALRIDGSSLTVKNAELYITAEASIWQMLTSFRHLGTEKHSGV